MQEWKKNSNGKTALLIEGARRIGKSTVVEEFAKNEYQSYLLIDFSRASKETKELFEDVSDLNYLFLQLQLQYKIDLQERNSVIIFDLFALSGCYFNSRISVRFQQKCILCKSYSFNF